MTKSNDAKAHNDAINQSRTLWPDPFDAPDVPPLAVLEQYLNGGDELDPSLAQQILESVNCRRALDCLTMRAAVPPDVAPEVVLRSKLNPALLAERANRLLVKPGPVTRAKRPVSRRSVEGAAISAGQIWSTRSEVEVFRGGRFEIRRTWQPPYAFILHKQRQVGSDVIHRAIPCTPAWLWWGIKPSAKDRVGGVENFNENWVIHPSLDCWVSRSQLYAQVGTTADEGTPRIALGGVPFLSEEGMQTGWSLKQLSWAREYERSKWLGATATARLDWIAWAEQQADRLAEALPQCASILRALRDSFGRSRSTDTAGEAVSLQDMMTQTVKIPCFLWPGELDDLGAAGRVTRDLRRIQGFGAMLNSESCTGGTNPNSQVLYLRINYLPSAVSGGDCFFAVDLTAQKVVGYGYLGLPEREPATLIVDESTPFGPGETILLFFRRENAHPPEGRWFKS